jgi:hypothetical protein
VGEDCTARRQRGAAEWYDGCAAGWERWTTVVLLGGTDRAVLLGGTTAALLSERGGRRLCC